MPLLGAHLSIAGGLHKALLRGERIGCEVIQIFTRNRNRWNVPPLSTEEINQFHRTREKSSVRVCAVHDSYLINIASPRPEFFERSCQALLNELERARLLRIPFLVMHPGSHLGEGEGNGIRRIAEAIKRILDRSGARGVKILLETTAGQGTNIGYRFEHLAEIFSLTDDVNPMGVCFDTCHAFAAGYDFRTPEGYRKVFSEFDKIIGLDRLLLFHLNDSQKRAGSRTDRHEHLGKGTIGIKAFARLLNDPRFGRHPFVLETPKGLSEKGEDLDWLNLRVLRKLMKGEGPK